MPPAALEIRTIDLHHATDAEYAGLNTLSNACLREFRPEDPPHPLEEDMRRLKVQNPLKDSAAWLAVDSATGQVAALGVADIILSGDNPRLMWFDISVLPEFRRQGVGTSLLSQLAAHARARDRDLLTIECHDRAPAGPAFLQRIGAVQGLVEALNQLRLADLDSDLLQAWRDLGSALSADFELGLWDKAYPDEHLPAVAHLLQQVANETPRDSLQMEDTHFTPELVRGFDEEQRAGGDQRWTLYAIHRDSAQLAGITEVFWNPNRPTILSQGFTGVMPAHRGRGLGRWLKSEMLARLLRDRPQLQVIRTGNADSNAPMLNMNRALGFRRYAAWVTWQVELPAVERYLASRT